MRPRSRTARPREHSQGCESEWSSILSARGCARCGCGWGSAGSDAHRSAIAKDAAVGERDAIQEAPGLAAAKRAHDRGDLVALLDGVELPAAAHEDARATQLDGPVLRRLTIWDI